MASVKLLLTLCVVAFYSIVSTMSAADESEFEVDLRSEDGKVVVSADQIVSYDWAAHTLTLKPGVRGELAKRLRNDRIVSGIPFAVCVGGKAIYKGAFTSVLSSKSFSIPMIVVDLPAVKEGDGEDQLQVQLGYPGADFFKGDDPRSDRRIRDSLVMSGKLIAAELEHTKWVVKSLREMQTITPGMTRKALMKVFQEEGGLSNRTQQRFAYRECPYFKVNVTFEAVDMPDDKLKFDSKDKIKTISTPFLEWSIED